LSHRPPPVALPRDTTRGIEPAQPQLATISGTSTALTNHKHSQDEILDGFIRYWEAGGVNYNRSLLERFFRSVQVETRHLALPIEDYPELASFTESNQAYVEVGCRLAEQSVGGALAAADLEPEDVDAIFFTTVTGASVPTVDAMLANRLGFRSDVKRSPFFGLGCVAGVAGMARMADYLRAWPDHVAILLSVELCSLTLQKDDLSIPAMVSAALFGDGSAAIVGLGRERCLGRSDQPSLPRILATRSVFYPDTERVMGWDIGSYGFKVVLSADVPEIVHENARRDVESFLAENGLSLADIDSWVCHPGGPKVIEALQSTLGLEESDLAVTWNSLRSVGNLSSGSVLFVLHETLSRHQRPPGSYGLMLAMGPGFCAEMLLFQW
jgi:alkylresorcinol/alkylpyrone synthase